LAAAARSCHYLTVDLDKEVSMVRKVAGVWLAVMVLVLAAGVLEARETAAAGPPPAANTHKSHHRGTTHRSAHHRTTHHARSHRHASRSGGHGTTAHHHPADTTVAR
jgi:hypothetical protein